MFKGQQVNREECGRELCRQGRINGKIVVFDADVCTSSKISIFRDAFPERFVQAGIAEANMAGMAAGLATIGGFIPVISTFACFASRRMMDQASISIAYPKLNVKIIGAYGGIPTGKAGATHQAFEDISVMRTIPNMVVIVPCDGPQTRAAVRAMLKHEGPVYLRTARNQNPVIFDDDCELEIGRGIMLKEGSDVTIVSTGIRTQTAVEASWELGKNGISAEHIYIHTVKPLDKNIILQSAKKTNRVITIENHSIIGGLGSAISELLSEEYPCRMKRLGIKDHFGESGDDEALFEKYGLAVKDVVAAAKKLLK